VTRREILIPVCDVCGVEGDGVETRRMGVDGVWVEAEVCAADWAEILKGIAAMARVGRELPRRTRIKGTAKPWPGTAWRFTDHALMRLAERHLDPVEIVKVIDDPTTIRPGNASDLEIRERGKLKAVVAPDRAIVITVARREEADE
jgi:hypothetical protein